MVQIKVKIIDNATKQLIRKSELMQLKLSQAVMQGALILQGEIMQSISGHRAEPRSFDTGLFMRSVNVERTGKYSAKVFTTLDYPVYLEYGTTKIKPRHHFTNSIFRMKPVIMDHIRKSIF